MCIYRACAFTELLGVCGKPGCVKNANISCGVASSLDASPSVIGHLIRGADIRLAWPSFYVSERAYSDPTSPLRAVDEMQNRVV